MSVIDVVATKATIDNISGFGEIFKSISQW